MRRALDGPARRRKYLDTSVLGRGIQAPPESAVLVRPARRAPVPPKPAGPAAAPAPHGLYLASLNGVTLPRSDRRGASMEDGHHPVTEDIKAAFDKLGGYVPADKDDMLRIMHSLGSIFESAGLNLTRFSEGLPHEVNQPVRDAVAEVGKQAHGQQAVADDAVTRVYQEHGFWLGSKG